MQSCLPQLFILIRFLADGIHILVRHAPERRKRRGVLGAERRPPSTVRSARARRAYGRLVAAGTSRTPHDAVEAYDDQVECDALDDR